MESKYLTKQSKIGQTKKKHNETINNKELEYSGHYLYDEQFLRLNGTKHYRLTLFDAILNIPVSERIVRHRIPKKTLKNSS